MTCQLEIVSEHRDIVGDDAIREFREEGGTQSAARCKMTGSCRIRTAIISGRHAAIDYKGGIVLPRRH